MTRAERLERYQALPLPTTKDEHWRFTDLKGFDPEAWTANGAAEIAAPPSLLDLDVAGIAHVGEAGIEIARAPDEDPVRAADRRPRASLLARRLGREVRGAQRRAVEARPARARAARSRRREAALRQDRERRRGRVALLAAADRRGARVPVHADRGVRVGVGRARRLLERGGGDRRPGRREGRVRVRSEPVAIDLALRVASRAGRARRRARLGRGRLRLRQGQGADPERSRRARVRPRA